MTDRKKKRKRTPAKKSKNSSALEKVSEEFREQAARNNLSPSVSAAALIKQTREVKSVTPDRKGEHTPSLEELKEAISEKIKKVQGGDMGEMEAILVSQAHALDALFQNLTTRAMQQGLLRQLEVMMKLALQAQNQCRTTVEALSAVKNPRKAVALVGQTNIAGIQQVNNAPAPVIEDSGSQGEAGCLGRHRREQKQPIEISRQDFPK